MVSRSGESRETIFFFSVSALGAIGFLPAMCRDLLGNFNMILNQIPIFFILHIPFPSIVMFPAMCNPLLVA